METRISPSALWTSSQALAGAPLEAAKEQSGDEKERGAAIGHEKGVQARGGVSGRDECRREEKDECQDSSHKGVVVRLLKSAGERLRFGGNGGVPHRGRDLGWQWVPNCRCLLRCAWGAGHETGEHDDVGENDQRHDHRGEKAEREVCHDGHGVPAEEHNDGSSFDDEKDVDQPGNVPGEEGSFIFPGARNNEKRDGAEGDNNVPPPCRDGELAREKTARVQDEKIDSHKTDKVRKDQGAKMKTFEAAAERSGEPIGGDQSGREAQNRNRNGSARQEGKQLDFADEQGDQEPTGHEQEERPAADRTFFGATGHWLEWIEWMMRRR